ncbi:hypothetical protein [Streptomyces sp. NPDC003077]|uniref:hypothetical protein n=1 Tax=Streptomyces sp. NPDC003077 TaxID=3154443 RepID=UPI0033AE505E
MGQAVMLHRGGDREEARNRLRALWEEVGPRGDPFHRCALAHYLADTQDDPLDELHWDLMALDAAERSTATAAGPERGSAGPEQHGAARGQGSAGPEQDGAGPEQDEAGRPGAERSGAGRSGAADDRSAARRFPPALRAFFPSLHLSLAADYARLDCRREARAQLGQARAAVDALADGAYRQSLREAIVRLARNVEGTPGQEP